MSKKRKIIAKDIKVSSRKARNIKLLDSQGGNAGLIEDLTKKAAEQIEALQKENTELKDRLLRKAAEFDNAKKIIDKDVKTTIESKTAVIFRELIDILDNFDRAIEHMNNGNGNDMESILEGIKKIDKRFHDFLEKSGIEQFSAQGNRFDPTMHEAISVTTNPGIEDGIVIEEFVKGYKFNGRVIRPARVIVNKVSDESEESND